VQPPVGDLRYAVLHCMLLTVTKNPQNVQKALKNFTEILNIDVRLLHSFWFAHFYVYCKMFNNYFQSLIGCDLIDLVFATIIVSINVDIFDYFLYCDIV